MKRRVLLTSTAAGSLLSGMARAQQKVMPTIGVLGLNSPDDPPVALNLAAFQRALSEAGFVEGRNVAIEYRWAESHVDRLAVLAAQLVARNVDVIVTEGGDSSTLAAKNATSTIPIVFHSALDPVDSHLVASLARPGGNLTGVSLLLDGLSSKLLQLICDLVPQARVIALAVDPAQRSAAAVRLTQEAAKAKGVQLQLLKAGIVGGEIDAAFASLTQLHADALVVSYNSTQATHVAALAARYSIPAIYPQRAYPLVGGLLSYGPSVPDAYRIKGEYTARILNGTNPAALPVLQPTKFELVINMKTARTLGLTIPPSILARADEVIE